MKRGAIYLRVSTTQQTTANQERELREIADRMGCEIVKVYKDHGISESKGRDGRPAFDALCQAVLVLSLKPIPSTGTEFHNWVRHTSGPPRNRRVLFLFFIERR